MIGTGSLAWRDSCIAKGSCVATIGEGAEATRLAHTINPTAAIVSIPLTTGLTLIFGVKFITCLSLVVMRTEGPKKQRERYSYRQSPWVTRISGSPFVSCNY